MPPGTPRIPRAERTLARLRHFTEESLYASLREVKLHAAPGERYRYSNLGAALLGFALARRAGRVYEELVRERICEPLGLRDTVITVSEEQASRLAVGHTVLRGKPLPPWEDPGLAPAGSLRSTLEDMLRFVRACLGAAPPELAQALELARTPRADAGKRSRVGLGWHLSPLGATLRERLRRPRPGQPWMTWHNGATAGFHSFVAFVPGRQAGVVLLGNRLTGVELAGMRILAET
jgi:CubicO group peptidase (beta-lactamase class C family)